MVSYLCGRQFEKKAVAGRRRLQEMDHGGGGRAHANPQQSPILVLFFLSLRRVELAAWHRLDREAVWESRVQMRTLGWRGDCRTFTEHIIQRVLGVRVC